MGEKHIGDLLREPYADWIKRLCERCGIPWREEYAVPLDDKPKEQNNGDH